MEQEWPAPAGAGFAYEVALRSLDEQLERIEALDTKAAVLLTADGVIAGFLFGRDSAIREAPDWLAIAAIAGLMASFILALVTFASRRYQQAPPAVAVARRAQAPGDWLKWRFLANVHLAIDVNNSKLRQKSRLLTAGLGCLLASLLTLGGYLIDAILRS